MKLKPLVYAIDETKYPDPGMERESVLEKLKLNCRSILESQKEIDKDLMDLCLDVIYNTNMKALGLHNLVLLFVEWQEKTKEEESAE